MKIQLRLFAGLREKTGCADELLDTPAEVRTVSDLRAWLAARGEGWEALVTQKNLRSALDQTMVPAGVEAQTLLHENAEVAFFPPVTGG